MGNAVALGTLYALLAGIERATGGWGFGGSAVGLDELYPGELWAVHPMLALLRRAAP